MGGSKGGDSPPWWFSFMSDPARPIGPALEAHQRFLTWLIPTLDKFPRAQRFLLGDRIESTALDVLERLIEATYTRERHRILRQANLDLTKLRHLLRLAHDLRYLDPRRYEHAARAIDETGRCIGGWIKEQTAAGAGNGAAA
jgi:hypothetical protein